tara:strand:- start:468 stop:647 length:180 start_codon:yes stop_codon:yes gene_type:complete
MAKKYKILQSATYIESIVVEANSKEEAQKKVEEGDWTLKDIVDRDFVDRKDIGDVKEIN